MSDELPMDVPATGPDELTAASTRLATAQAEYDRADALEDEFGDAIPSEITFELSRARRAVAAAEARAMHRLKQ